MFELEGLFLYNHLPTIRTQSDHMIKGAISGYPRLYNRMLRKPLQFVHTWLMILSLD